MIRKITFILAAALALVACQSHAPYQDRQRIGASNGYDRYEPCHQCGFVEDVRRVDLADDSIGIGAVIGAVVGAAAGHQVGDGSGQDAATAAGAIGGAIAGHEIQKRRRARETGYQFVVELDDGRMARVTQERHYGLDEGDRVRLIDDRVVPI